MRPLGLLAFSNSALRSLPLPTIPLRGTPPLVHAPPIVKRYRDGKTDSSRLFPSVTYNFPVRSKKNDRSGAIAARFFLVAAKPLKFSIVTAASSSLNLDETLSFFFFF